MPELRYWPADFPVVDPTTDFDVALVSFFDQMVAAGTSVYVDQMWSLFGFSRGERRIDFVRRGRLRRGAGQCWEVWPYDGVNSLRLGPIFNIREYACVVIHGICDIRIIVDRWLGGTTMAALIDGVDFWDRMDSSQPLEAQP
jgi:hypothetical protein